MICKNNLKRKYIDNFSDSHLKIAFCFVFVAICGFATASQRLSTRFLKYIDTYKDIAISEAQEYGVPACITLAQGLLESGAGQSYLARVGRNHFGIKCHKSWKGDRVTVGDEANSISYRQYKRVSDSYLDHARFLQSPRYKKLYDLDITDYKGWARGLQQCGYAEDPNYASQLISLIEQYCLIQYDQGQPVVAYRHHLAPDSTLDPELDEKARKAMLKKVEFLHAVHRKWNLHYIIAMKGDTYESIALEFNLKPDRVMAFNDIEDAHAVPAIGDWVWVERKAKSAPENFDLYTVREGESLWVIAQMFGIRLNSLLKLNDMKKDTEVEEGQQIRLR